MNRVAVIKLRHLGDVLLTTPVLHSLRCAYANADLIACVNEGTGAILETNRDINQVIEIPVRKRRWPQNWLAELAAARKLRTLKPDLVVDLTGTDRSAILSRFSGAPQRWGLARQSGFFGKNRLYTKAIPKRFGLHVVEFQQRFLEDCGLPHLEPTLHLPVADQSRKEAALLVGRLERYVHLHPVSRLMVKSWPVAYTAALITYLQRRGLPVVITSSADPAETGWVSELIKLAEVPCINLSGKVSLSQLAAISKGAAVFIGVDSAPMHIAAAVGTPVIGIFGPSSEILWGPWCEKKLVLARDDLDCRLPCKLKSACPHIACLREMTPDMVLPKVDGFLTALGL
jgi:heptosyltransferase III